MGVKPTSMRHLTVNRITGEKLSKPEFWLYDKTRGMNLAMRAESPEDALVQAVTYYQKRTQSLEFELTILKGKVNSFLDQFRDNDDEDCPGNMPEL